MSRIVSTAIVVFLIALAGASLEPHAQSTAAAQAAGYTAPTIVQGWTTRAVTVTWPAAFVDASYAAVCTAVDSAAASVRRARVARVQSQTANDVTIVVVNDDTIPGSTTPIAVNCSGIHN